MGCFVSLRKGTVRFQKPLDEKENSVMILKYYFCMPLLVMLSSSRQMLMAFALGITFLKEK